MCFQISLLASCGHIELQKLLFAVNYGKLCKACASHPASQSHFFSSHKVFSRGKLVAHGRKLYMVDYKKHMITSTNYKMKSMFISQGFLEFNVTHEMVPSSRILLFYVREDRETVAATMQFDTEATLENEVCALN